MNAGPAQAVMTGGGVVHTPRRPAGFRAPGPRPAGDASDPVWCPGPLEDLCMLAGDWRIYQRVDGHRWSLDDLVTAWVATRVAPEARSVVDLGCGIGSVLLLCAWAMPTARLTGVEAQDTSVPLARRSVAFNGCADRVDVVHGDFREAVATLAAGRDLVTGTPPYFRPGAGTVSSRVQCAPCRFELRGGVEAYAAAAARLVGPGAPFVVCAGALQRAQVERALAIEGFDEVRRMEVVPREGRSPLLDVWVGWRGGRPPSAVRDVPERMVVRDGVGQWTPAFRAVRRDFGMPDVPAGPVA